MPKDLRFSLLLEYYGTLLSDKQYEMISSYYDLDLSLSEIAENEGMTRQGVRDYIKRAEVQLLEYDEKLGLIEQYKKLKDTYSKAAETGNLFLLGDLINNL